MPDSVVGNTADPLEIVAYELPTEETVADEMVADDTVADELGCVSTLVSLRVLDAIG